jgi:hypothetical protein
VRQHNLEAAQKTFPDFGFKVTTGNRYLGGFIGKENALRDWIQEKTKLWEEAVADPASAAPNQLFRPAEIVFRPAEIPATSCLFRPAEIPATRMTICPTRYKECWTEVRGCRSGPVQNFSCQLCLVVMTTAMMILCATSPVSQ